MRIYPHLAFTSELDTRRWDMRSGFKSEAFEPLLKRLCINMMQTVASYLCRGIEAVITGLTRNQFVDNTTRGFESLPLRQIRTQNRIQEIVPNLRFLLLFRGSFALLKHKNHMLQ